MHPYIDIHTYDIHTCRDTMRVSAAEGRRTNEDVAANHLIKKKIERSGGAKHEGGGSKPPKKKEI
jgi:hypothetical protein